MSEPRANACVQVFERLLAAYGAQHWWPGDSPFEIMVGAVLTQNTAWTNVEKAIARLKEAHCLTPQAILERSPDTLAALIRPAGYFNVKARRLRNLCRYLLAAGGEQALANLQTAPLRAALLEINGVGPETADDILLYALERPVFVVDSYTRRLGERLGLLRGGEHYEDVRRLFEQAIGADARVFNELHGLIVYHAKHRCRKRPRCAGCCLAATCDYPKEQRAVGQARC